jgi:hypothetical protein
LLNLRRQGRTGSRGSTVVPLEELVDEFHIGAEGALHVTRNLLQLREQRLDKG